MIKIIAFVLISFMSSCFVKSKTVCTNSNSKDPFCAKEKLSEAYMENRVSRVAIKIELLLTDEGSSRLLVDPQDLQVAAYVQSTEGFEPVEFYFDSGEFLDKIPISTADLKREIPVTIVIPKEISDRLAVDADGYYLYKFELSGQPIPLLGWLQEAGTPLMKTLIAAKPQTEYTPSTLAVLSIASSIATDLTLKIYANAALPSLASKVESVRKAIDNLQIEIESLLQPLQSEKKVEEIIEIIKTFTVAKILIDKTTQESLTSNLTPATDLESSKVNLEQYIDSLAGALTDLATKTQDTFANKKAQMSEATSVSTVEQFQSQTISTESNTADLVFTPEALAFEDTDNSSKIAGVIRIELPRVKTGLTACIVYLGPQQLAKDAIVSKSGLRELGRMDIAADQSTANLTIEGETLLTGETNFWVFSVAGSSVINVPLVANLSNTISDNVSPTAGGSLSFSNVAETSLTVSWPAASDSDTAQSSLQYKLVRATSSAAIDTIAEADAITGASLVMDWTAHTTTRNVTGLSPATTYHFAVMAKDASNNKVLYTLNSQATIDSTAPTAGSSIAFSSITSSTATVSWGAASDAATPNAANLEYKLVIASTTGAIDSISEVDAISGGSLLMNWTAGTTSQAVSGLVMNTAYYFAVLVRDSSNNRALYSPQGFTTSCTCSAGSYSSSGNCIAAEAGYYATSCNRFACSNKPNNSSYLGSGFSSDSCAWACDNGYVANSSYTECTSNSNYIPLSCGSNQLVVGLSGRAASWIDKLGVRCQNFAGGALTGSIQTGTEFGGSGGTAFSRDCPSGSAVQEIDYGNHVGNSQNVAGRIRFRCKNLSTGSVSSWLPLNGETAASNVSGSNYYGSSSSIGTGTMACASPYYANWFTIESSGGYTGVFSGALGCRSIASLTNIVAQWQFEGSAVDSSPSGSNPLTSYGGLSFSGSTKKYGSHAAYFDGIDDYFSSGSSLLNGLSAFTVVGWIRVSSRVGSGKVSFWGQNDLIEMGFNDSGVDNDICVWVNGSNEQCSNSNISLDTWYQIAITMSAANGTILYINGSQVSSTPISTTGSTSAFPFSIGGGVWNPSGDYLNGYVDDVLIYSRELSATEVAQLYGN